MAMPLPSGHGSSVVVGSVVVVGSAVVVVSQSQVVVEVDVVEEVVLVVVHMSAAGAGSETPRWQSV
jgi:hypothetical protein